MCDRCAVENFNGATAFQPWKPVTDKHAKPNELETSMGPRPFSRGNISANANLVASYATSMGPRHFSRGNQIGGRRPAAGEEGLQWGHGLSAVETPV